MKVHARSIFQPPVYVLVVGKFGLVNKSSPVCVCVCVCACSVLACVISSLGHVKTSWLLLAVGVAQQRRIGERRCVTLVL